MRERVARAAAAHDAAPARGAGDRVAGCRLRRVPDSAAMIVAPDEVRRRPVGVFDSGVGGLTVLHELLVRLPHEDYLYLADSARLPYGSRAPEELQAFALEIAEELLARGIKLLVVACNSATAAALPALRERLMQTTLGVEVLGVVQPAAVQAVAATRRGKVGVLGTPATVATGAYAGAIAAIDPFVEVVSVSCGDLAMRIESGTIDEPLVDEVRGLLRAAARRRRRHRDPRLHALSARAPHHPADARPGDDDRHLGRAARAPGRARARHARARQPGPRRGGLRLPLHRRPGRLPGAGHALPPAAARRGRPRGDRARRWAGRWRRDRRGAPRASAARPRRRRPAPGHDPARLRAHGDRLGADRVRRDARDLHRVDPGVRPALDGGPRPRLGHRRVRDAARVDRRPQGARRQQGPRRRAHRRDPAADRPLAARRGRLRRARRAHDLHRLRRADRRRRHALRVDHRRLRRARARAPAARRRGQARARRRSPARSPRSRAGSSTARRCSTSTTPRTRPPRSTRTWS